MDNKTFRLAAGFVLPAVKKGGCKNQKVRFRVEQCLKEGIIDDKIFGELKMFSSFIEKIREKMKKDKIDYDVVNAYITGKDVINMQGQDIITEMIRETTMLNINITIPLPPTHNSYTLCIARIHPFFNDCMVRPATVLDDKKVIFHWRIGKGYNIEMGEVGEVEFLPNVKNVNPGDIVLVHYGEAFWKANDKQLKAINENVRMVCKKFGDIIGKPSD